MNSFGSYAVVILLTFTGAVMLFSKKDLGAEFTMGCKEGLDTTVKLLPGLVMLICASRMFAASGALAFVEGFCGILLSPFGVPKELFPLCILRPISGSGATALLDELFALHGPDSFVGRCASILASSTDTILYTFALYFGSVGVRHTRHAFPTAFLMLLLSTVLSVLLTRLFYA